MVAFGLSSLACSDDIIDVPEELRGEPYCALIIGTFGHYEDGDRWLIADYASASVASGCVCATEEEIVSGERDQDLNDAALAECEFQASLKDFAWDECREDYDTQEWLYLIVHAEGEDAYHKPADLRCVGE